MNRKKVLLAVLCLVIGIVIAVGFAWNKPHNKVEDESSISVSAVALKDAYSKDEEAANKLYLNKALKIAGTVAGMDKNQDGGSMLLLDTGDPMNSIQCTLRDKNEVIPSGKAVTIKGFCTGNNMLGITLTDCIVETK